MTSQARYSVWGGSIIFIILILWAMVAFVTSGTNTPTGPTSLAVPVSADEYFEGNASSTVTLVEYSDFQCPACAAYHSVVKKLVTEKGKQFKFVYRVFPLSTIHMNADLSAQAALAAGKQGKFWEMHDKLFSTQTDWERDIKAEARFIGYAKDLGLDVSQFSSDLNDRSTRKMINDSYKGGIQSGVVGTPTFFLNGKPIQNPASYDAFAALIDAAGAPATTTATTTSVGNILKP